MRQLRHRPFALSGVICFLFVMTGAPAMAAEPRLAPSASRKPVTLPVSLEGKRMATYGGGGLVVAEGDMAEPSVFSVYGANGNLLFHVPLKIPGASRVVVYDYSRTSTGILVACGFAESPGVQRAPYLTWFSADGSSQKVIRTDPYYPFLCAGAPDGSLWTVGLEMNADLQEKPEHRESPVLRRFAPDGRQLGAWLPRSSFPGSAELVRGFLVASNKRVGWLRWSADSGLEGVYAEITPEGEITSFPLKQVPGFKAGIGAFSGMALTADGDALVAAVPSDKTEATAVLWLDRSKAEWRRVSVPVAASPPFFHIYGADTELALYAGGDDKSRVRFFRLER
jgi:hypothetical protein